MLYHIVSFHLVENDSFVVELVKRELMGLKALNYAMDFEVSDLIEKKSQAGLVLFSTFQNKNLLAAYMEDPYHLEVIRKTSPLIRRKQITDFEI